LQDIQKSSYIKGAAILAATSIILRIIGAIYHLPLMNILGAEGAGHWGVTHNIFMMLLAVTSAGLPIAMSRLVSLAAANRDIGLTKRYFSVALPAFIAIGIVAMALTFIFADTIAVWMNNSYAALGIRVLAPAVLFGCIISVYRGFAQGFENMVPTAVSQIVDVIIRSAFGIVIAIILSRALYESYVVSAGALLGITLGLALCIPVLMWYKRKIIKTLPSEIETKSDSLPSKSSVLAQLIKVTVPITVGLSIITIMTVINQSIVIGRLQNALHFTERAAMYEFGMYQMGLRIYNLPAAIIIPVATAIVPAIAATLAAKRIDEAKGIMQSSIKLVNLISFPAGAGMVVMARPIITALYYENAALPLTSNILMVLGVASILLCLQLVTTAILQAHGHERAAMMTIPVSAVIKLILSYYLVAIPEIGVLGSPIGTVVFFAVIVVLNFILIRVKIKNRPKLAVVFLKPLLCTAIMAVVAHFTYSLVQYVGSDIIGTGRMAISLYLAVAMFAAIAVYGILIVVTRAITLEDMKLVPKGEKLAKILRIRN
jgi:stage V sporulation protein B